MTLLHFTGQRRREITISGPVTGALYYLTPGEPLEVAETDAAALIERDPHLWSRKNPAGQTVEVAAVELPAEAEPEFPTPARKSRPGER